MSEQAIQRGIESAFGHVGSMAANMVQEAWQNLPDIIGAWQRPSVLYRPSIARDGNKWSALYGDNIMEGVCGYGDTPEQAMADFDRNWREQRIAAAATEPEKQEAPSETWWARVFRVVREANCAEGNSSTAGRELGALLVNHVELTVCARGKPHAYGPKGRLVKVANPSGWLLHGPWVAELERDIDALEASIPALREARAAKLAADRAKADAEIVAEIMEARKRAGL